MTARLISLWYVRDVLSLLGVGRSTLYRWIRTGTFPEPCSVGGSSTMVFWYQCDIDEWLEARKNSV